MSDYEIIKYILNDINEDLDDEEKVHLLLNKTVSENNECKESFGQALLSCRKLDVRYRLHSAFTRLDNSKYGFGGKVVRPVPVYSAEPCLVVRFGYSGTSYYDESKATGRKRPSAQRK